MVVQPWDRVPVPTQKNKHNNVLEFFYRTGAPPKWRWRNFRLSTRFLEHNFVASPPINQSHKPCSPHSKCCLLFLETSNDHPVRSPVWPLSISSLRGANSFQLYCCYYKSECWFQAKKYLDLDQLERDLCSARQAYTHAQQEEVTEERDLRSNSHEYEVSLGELLGEAHWLKLPTLARHHGNYLHELF